MFKRYKAAKRVLALLLCGCLVFGSVNQARFKSYAIVTEIIAGGAAIAGGLAIGYLLHMLGVTASSKEVYKSKETVIDWANQQVAKYKKWNAATKDAYKSDDLDKEFDTWTTNLKQGVLDKSSAVWSDFKSWVSRGIYKVKAGGVYIGSNAGFSIPTSEDGSYYRRFGTDGTCSKQVFLSASLPSGSGRLFYVVYCESDSVKVTALQCYGDTVTRDNSYTIRGHKGEWQCVSIPYVNYSAIEKYGAIFPNYQGELSSGMTSDETYDIMLERGKAIIEGGYSAGTVAGEYGFTGGISDVYNKSTALDNVDIVGGVDTPTAVGAVSVPIAWPVNEDTLVGTLGGVQDGSIPWDRTLTNVGTAAVDVADGKTYVIGNEKVTTIEYVYAKDKADAKDEEITVPDVVAPSANLGAYTIAGLEKMFPFCLPFDLIDFIKVLDAPAEAPRFTIPFKYPTRGGMATYNIVIDLSSFNSVAELLRDMECLAFIVGLIMITRSRMIRG